MNTSTMFHHTHQSFANANAPSSSSSRRLAYDGVRARSVGDTVDFGHPPASYQRCSSHGRWETGAATEEEECDVHDFDDFDDDDDDDDDAQEPMDLMYEREVQQRGGLDHHHHYHYNRRDHRDNIDHRPRCQSEPILRSASAIASDAASNDLDMRLSMSSDHLVALLQREAGHYSTPLPVRYYPTEFAEEATTSSSSPSDGGDDDGSPSPRGKTSVTIGPWRKRIASWMYDVVDHFQYDRNAVSVALTYIDRHVGHVLVENERVRRRGGGDGGYEGGSGSGPAGEGGMREPPIKRRHFQLIAVTCLYLAIKVHGELMEDDPVTGVTYDVVASLVHEVDGRAFLGERVQGDDDDIDNDDCKFEEEDEDDADQNECDDDLRAMSRKIADLTRRHRMGRWGSRLGQFGLPLAGAVHPHSCGAERAPRNGSGHQSMSAPSTSSSQVPPAPHSSLPYKPRKRGMLSGPLRLHSFVELSRGLFTARDIVETEMRVLVSMNYVVNPPTSHRFVGELLRMLALSYTGAAYVDVRGMSSARTAERALGLDRREILTAVLGSARQQIEGAAAVPALSMGCLPSIVAYSAMLNSIEETFEKFASSSSAMETDNDDNSPQLEDYQRHYRRYSRSHSSGASSTKTRRPSDRDLFIEAWKQQFLVAVFHATDGILSPNSHDIFRVRELLLEQARPALTGGAQSMSSATAAPTTTSPTEGPKSDGSKTRRSPRSPRSVVFPNPRMLRGGSFFRQGSGLSSTGGDTARLLSPYDARGRSPLSFRSLSGGVSAATATLPHRMYYKQTSEPIAGIAAMSGDHGRQPEGGRFARAPTPDLSVFQSNISKRGNLSNYEADSRMSTGETTQPPLFFSA